MNKDIVRAQGMALALVGALLERHDGLERGEFGRLLGLLAALTGETSKVQGEILALWSAMASETSLHR